MPQASPLECPVCGHERIARRPPQLRTGSGQWRIGINEWMCQLCSYTWSRPRSPEREPVWELE